MEKIMNDENEIWVQLYDFENYEVSNLGRIRSKNYQMSIGVRNGIEYFRDKPLHYKAFRTNNIEPFLFTDIYTKDKQGKKIQKTIYVHRAVADHFVKKSPFHKGEENKGKHLYASHIIKDYTNNRWDNLQFITHSQLIRSQPKRLADPNKHWRTRREKYKNNWGSLIKPKGRPKKDKDE